MTLPLQQGETSAIKQALERSCQSPDCAAHAVLTLGDTWLRSLAADSRSPRDVTFVPLRKPRRARS